MRLKIRCPKCASTSITWYVEEIYRHPYSSSKTGIINFSKQEKKMKCLLESRVGNGAEQIVCNNCGYEEHPLMDQNDFIVKELKGNQYE